VGALQDKVAFVTGSSRGIGAAIVKLFASEGAKVVVQGRDTAAIAATAKDIEGAGGRTLTLTGDVTRFSELERMRSRIESDFGSIDILTASLRRPS
jgi:3-oxoacyl-[acyl-carrier protein] reductase